MEFIAALAGIVGTAAQFGFFAQTYKIVKHKSINGVSVSTYLIFLVSIVVWLAYGIAYKQMALIVTNFVAILGCSSVIIAYYIYKGRLNDAE